MEDDEPISPAGRAVSRIHLALTRSSDFLRGFGETILEIAFWWRTEGSIWSRGPRDSRAGGGPVQLSRICPTGRWAIAPTSCGTLRRLMFAVLGRRTAIESLTRDTRHREHVHERVSARAINIAIGDSFFGWCGGQRQVQLMKSVKGHRQKSASFNLRLSSVLLGLVLLGTVGAVPIAANASAPDLSPAR